MVLYKVSTTHPVLGEILAWGSSIAGARKLRHDMYRKYEPEIKLHYVYVEKMVVPTNDKTSFAQWMSVHCTKGK